MKIQKTNLKASSFLHMIAAASITVCMFTSCNGGLTEQSESDPAGTYRNYLLEVRKMKSVSFEELSENLCQWQAIRDSVLTMSGRTRLGSMVKTFVKHAKAYMIPYAWSSRVWLCQGHVPIRSYSY